MFKFGDYTIRREPLNFVVEYTHKNMSKPQEGKKHNEFVTTTIGYFGSFRQAVTRIANETVLDPVNSATEILDKLDAIDNKLENLEK